MASCARLTLAPRAPAPRRYVAAKAAPPASVGAPASKYAVVEIGGVQQIVEEGR